MVNNVLFHALMSQLKILQTMNTHRTFILKVYFLIYIDSRYM